MNTLQHSRPPDGRYGSTTQQEALRVRQIELATEALRDGLDRGAVIRALLSRMRRDEAYLRYRQGRGLHTSYDDQVAADLRALALAACYLEEEAPDATDTVAVE